MSAVPVEAHRAVETPTPQGLRNAGKSRRRALPPSAETLLVVLAYGAIGFLFLDNSMLFLAITAMVMGLFAMSTNVLFGWTGLASFGQAAYFGTAAYAVAIFAEKGYGPITTILVGTAIAATLAFVFAILSARVSGVQFAILTLALGQVLWLMTFRIDDLKGENGIFVFRGELFGLDLFDPVNFWFYSLAVVGMSLYLLRRIRGSSLGISMAAVRDDPMRAAALGINVRWVRRLAFVLAGGFAGVAGALYAQQQGIVTPNVLYFALSGDVIVMCIIGGLRKFWGPAIGAVLLTFLNWSLLDSVTAPDLYVGLLLLLIVLLLPFGVAGLPEKIMSLRRKGGVGND